MSARVTACACVHACVHEYAHKDIVTLTSVVEGLAAKCLDACMTCARKLDARAELSAQSMYRLMFICGLKCDHDDKDSGQRAHAVDFVNRLSALGIAVVDRLLAKGQRGAATRTIALLIQNFAQAKVSYFRSSRFVEQDIPWF